MATIINADTSNGLKLTSDTSGILELQSGGVTQLTINSNGISAGVSGRNKIINGNMAINQRGSGALENGFLVDRFRVDSIAASKGSATVQTADVPTKFTSALKYTSSTAYSVLATDYFFVSQKIEGNNITDLNWGTADAQTITLSFWVKSSLTGTFGGALRNSAYNYNYPYTYTISSADTWEKKSVTITGPTSGTWLTTNGTGIDVWFSLGMGTTYSDTAGAWTTTAGLGSATGATSVVGTSGATWLVTGVQLEAGTISTDFEHLQYGQQLALCQRYYQTQSIAVNALSNSGVAGFSFNTIMRAAPTITWSSGGVANRQYRIDNGAVYDVTSVSMFSFVGGLNYFYSFSPSGWAGGAGLGFTSNYVMSAEL